MNTATLENSPRKPEPTAVGVPPLAAGSADWQVVTIISDTEYEEVNCNGGDRRRITKSRCVCGQPVLIEYDANRRRSPD